jgi:HK97 family phage portal protein
MVHTAGMFEWLRKAIGTQQAGNEFAAFSYGQDNVGKSRLYLDAYRGWVFACVNVIAEEVGAMNIRLMRGQTDDNVSDEEVYMHPLLELLSRPNPHLSGNDLLAVTSAHLDLDGNAFWYVIRGQTGIPIEVYPLRPDKTYIVQDKKNSLAIAGYIFKNEVGNDVPLDVNDVIHFKNFNPSAKYPFPSRGRGVVESAAVVIDTDEYAREYDRNFFLNSARPDGVLTYDGELSDSDFKRLKEQWNQEYRGTANARRTAILKNGMDYKEVGMNRSQMEFIEQRRFTRDEILAMFRVPKTILGITEDVNRANAEASNYVFGLRVLEPRFKKVVNTLNEFFVPMYGDDNLYISYDTPVPENRLETINAYAIGLNKWLTRNDIRRMEGMDETIRGDFFYGSMAEMPQDEVMQDEPVVDRSVRKKALVLKPLAEREQTPTAFDQHEFLDEKAVMQFGTMFEKRVELHHDVLKERLTSHFKEQGARIKKALRDELRGLEPEEYKLKDASLFFDVVNEIENTKALVMPHYHLFAKEAAAHALMLVKGAGDTSSKSKDKPRKVPDSQLVDEVDLDTDAYKKFLDERSEFFARRTNEAVRDDLFDTILADFEKDRKLSTIERHVDEVLDERAEKFNVDTVARTEVAALENFVNEQAYVQSGIKLMRWETVTPDSKIDEACLKNKGQVVPIGKSFSTGVKRPPEHPNCLCFTVPVR